MATFTKLRAMIGDLASQVKEREGEREKLLQRQEELQVLPITKEDFIDYINGVIDNARPQYYKNLQNYLNKVVHQNNPLSMPAQFPILSPAFGSAHNTAPTYAILALFGDSLKESVVEMVGSIEWPEAGPPLSERREEIQDIAKKLEKLESELTELYTIADNSGVRLSGIATVESGKKPFPGQRRSK